MSLCVTRFLEKMPERAEQAVWEFLKMDPVNPDTWYPDPPRRGIMVEIYQHQALWDNR